MDDHNLIQWLINNLLTDSQLDVVPPGEKKSPCAIDSKPLLTKHRALWSGFSPS